MFTIGVIGLMTLICVLGTELSARVQRVLILAQVGALLLFAAVALIKVAGNDAPAGSIDPELSWFSPFAVDSLSILVLGLLTGVFIYWGWESAVNLNEETEDSDTAPGLAAVVSTVVLLVTYVATAAAVVAFAGLDRVAEYEDDAGLFGAIATDVLGNGLDWIVVLAIITSALASTQTTILPASRTALSMARQGAFPGGARARAPAVPHSAHLDDRGRRDLGDLVRGPLQRLGELPVRLAHGAVADDRLLLRAERVRVRDLLPARADQVGEELLLHRRRAR